MARSAPLRTQMSFAEYLEFEQTAEQKHEFVDGQLFAMAGSTDRHNRLAFILATLAEQRAESCKVYLLEVKVRTPNDVGYYPDVFATCEAEEDALVKRKPCFIAEVLSKSTEATDRGEKLHNYSKIPSLKTYLLLAQEEAKVEVYSRQDDGSFRYDLLEADDLLKIPCVGLAVLVKEVYSRV